MTTLTADGAAIHAAILREPGCDLHRLAFADYLDEQGDPDRAEFIRVQVAKERDPNFHGFLCLPERSCRGCRSERDLLELHWRPWCGFPATYCGNYHDAGAVGATFRRGMVDVVRLSCAAFVGERCAMCRDKPKPCMGNACALGLARAIFAAHPVTRVVLTDIKPRAVRDTAPASIGRLAGVDDVGERGEWYFRSIPDVIPRSGVTHDVSPEVFDLLPDRKAYFGELHLAFYATAAAANDALSAGCVALGRSRAGLPPLAEGSAP